MKGHAALVCPSNCEAFLYVNLAFLICLDYYSYTKAAFLW